MDNIIEIIGGTAIGLFVVAETVEFIGGKTCIHMIGVALVCGSILGLITATALSLDFDYTRVIANGGYLDLAKCVATIIAAIIFFIGLGYLGRIVYMLGTAAVFDDNEKFLGWRK